MRNIFFIPFALLILFSCASEKESSKSMAVDVDRSSKVSNSKVSNSNQKQIQIMEEIFALHFVLRKLELSSAYDLVKKAKLYGYNTIVIQLTDGVSLDSAPWGESNDSWSKEQFVEFTDFVSSMGLQIIPEIKLFSHQEKFLKNNFPEFLYNARTYNPEAEGLYDEVVFPLIDELIEIMNPQMIHIGHDEVAGHNEKSSKKWLKKGEKIAPADLFLKDILIINEYLISKEVDVAIWGDMLIAENEFKEMFPQHLHGNKEGYGSTLRKNIPKNIVIFDWQYYAKGHNFSSTKTFLDEGFVVLGATWKNQKVIDNFTEFSANNNASGMVSTTWFHVQRKEWDEVEKIMEGSSSMYKKHFEQ